MTRMTGPDCAIMYNLINTHTHTHVHVFDNPRCARIDKVVKGKSN